MNSVAPVSVSTMRKKKGRSRITGTGARSPSDRHEIEKVMDELVAATEADDDAAVAELYAALEVPPALTAAT